VNYPALPRSGLPAPRLLRTGLPVSVSELVPDVDTAVPDSAGDFPSQVVRSVPLGHNRRCALLVALEHRYRCRRRRRRRRRYRQRRGEYRTIIFNRVGSKRTDERANKLCGGVSPPCPYSVPPLAFFQLLIILLMSVLVAGFQQYCIRNCPIILTLFVS
jgi:hypothetical protein